MENLHEILKTKESRKHAIAKTNNEITALETSIERAHEPMVVSALKRISREKKKYLKLISEKKKWYFNFQDGSHNWVVAETREEAIIAAEKEWKNYKQCVINPFTFRISTPDDEKNLI